MAAHSRWRVETELMAWGQVACLPRHAALFWCRGGASWLTAGCSWLQGPAACLFPRGSLLSCFEDLLEWTGASLAALTGEEWPGHLCGDGGCGDVVW